MTIAVVQSIDVAPGSTTPWPISFGAHPTPGNLIVVGVGCNNGGQVSTLVDNQTGNTYIRGPHAQDSRGGGFCTFSEIWYVGSVAWQSGTYTVSVQPVNAGGSPGLWIAEVSGTSGVLDKQGINQDTAGANTNLTVTATGANSQANAFVATMFFKPSATTDWTAAPTTGYTGKAVFNGNSQGISSTGGYKIVSATETSSAVAPTFSSNFVSGVIATFSASAPTAPVVVGAKQMPPMLGNKILGPLGIGGFALRASMPTVLPLPPFFTGLIPNLSYTQNTGTSTYNTSIFYSGATSYSISPALDAGISFNTVTGVISVDTTVLAIGTHGPYTVSGINSNGSTPSNTFTIAETPAVVSTGHYRRRFHRMT